MGLLSSYDCMDARIHPNPERKSAPGSAGLLAAAAREVLQAGLAGFRLLALRLRDDERAAAQVFCVVNLLFGQVGNLSF